MTYHLVSLDAHGEVLQVVRGKSERAVAGGRHPDAVRTIDTPPPGRGYFWRGNQWVAKGDRPSADHTWDTVAKEWSNQLTLDERKARKWATIKDARNLAATADYADGTFLYENLPDNRAQLAVIISSQEAAGLTGLLDTYPMTAVRASTGRTEQVMLNYPALRTLLRNMNEITKAAMTTGRGLKIQIEQAADAAAVDAISWPT